MNINPDLLVFLSELKQNNNREWFNDQKKRFEQLKKEFEDFGSNLMTEIHSFDKDIPLVPVKDCIFRIYKDVRFSNDKSPYKTNFGIFFSAGGKKGNLSGYYFHIEPDSCFASGGIYMPEPKILKAIRTEIYENSDSFLKIIKDKDFVKLFGSLWGESLVKAPKDFPSDFEHIQLLKLKNYVAMHPVKTEIITSENLTTYLIDVYRKVYPLNKFLDQIIKDM